jgi:predicted transposase YdaD
MYERREKALHDYASRMGGAREEGRAEGRIEERLDIARRLLKINRPIEEIMMVSNLSYAEIDALRQEEHAH